MGKKSEAQIRRNQRRAESRGETYHYQENNETSGEGNTVEKKPQSSAKTVDKKLVKVVTQLKASLEEISSNADLKAKDRRSAKRKAEAIAVEQAGNGQSAEALLEWLQEYQEQRHQNTTPSSSQEDNKKQSKKEENTKRNPYIVFIGQLSYDTTKESLLKHIQTELGKEEEHDFDVSEETVQVRLLTDAKTKKSRGMAFVEVSTPELLYACLKLHQTFLEGRRINVERSAGGKRNSEARQSKLQTYRKEQEEYMGTTVDAILEEFYQDGSIQKGELDDGVVALCKRHTATIVQAGLERYVESNGRDMDNPSAYAAFLMGKLAEEGIYDRKELLDSKKKEKRASFERGPPNKRSKRPRQEDNKPSQMRQESVLSKQGVDMSLSHTTGKNKDLSSIFPSFNRGRGRGR